MAASAFTFYGEAIERMAKGEIDWDGHTFKAILCTSSYTPDTDTHDDLADITNELSGGDYARVTLSGITVTRSTTTITVDCDNISFGNPVTLTAKYLIVYDDTHASDALIGYVDLDSGGGSVSSTAALFQYTVNASGLFTIAPA